MNWLVNQMAVTALKETRSRSEPTNDTARATNGVTHEITNLPAMPASAKITIHTNLATSDGCPVASNACVERLRVIIWSYPLSKLPTRHYSRQRSTLSYQN